MPGASSGEDLGVFDFKEEEPVKNKAERALSRLVPRSAGNPNPSSRLAGTFGGIDKDTFFHVFSGVDEGKEKHGSGVPYVEINESDDEVSHQVEREAPMEVDHEADCEASAEEAVEEAPTVKYDREELEGHEVERDDLMEETEAEVTVEVEAEEGLISSSSDTGEMIGDAFTERLTERDLGGTTFIAFVAQAKDVVASERSNEDGTERASDTDDNHSWSSASPGSYDVENEGCVDLLGTNVYPAGMEEMDMDTEVNISVEYFTYGDNCYGESQLTFLTDSIKVICKDGNDNNCFSEFKWSLANLLLINCHWSRSVETAWIEVRLKPTSINGYEGSPECSGTLSLTFTVLGSQWLRKEQKIASLAPAYKNAWRTDPVFSTTTGPDAHVDTVPLFSRQCISDDEAIFGDIIYPKGDPDAVCISKRDIELLKPETFINDTIIDFYIKFLKDKIKPEDRDKYHFFNSFFFRKLADLDKDHGCTLEGRAAFLRVRKWTRKINIFGKDYIFIPVNFNLHWSLVVICHPGEIHGFEDKELNQHCRVPCILHMDSIKGSHQGLKNHIQSYLWEEWKERHPDSPDESSEFFLNLRFVSLELPQQENSFDCGLFLLHYVELFLKEGPAHFSPFKIPESSHFLNLNWFVPAEASCKRFLLRELLYKLYRGEDINDSPFSVMGGPKSSVPSLKNLEKEAATHEPQSCPSAPDMVELTEHAVSGLDERKGTSTFTSILGDKDDELVSCQLLESGPRGISSNHIDFRQVRLLGPSLNVTEEAPGSFGCFDAEKDKNPYVNLEKTGMCSISLSINTGADLCQNQATANVGKSEDRSVMQAQALIDYSACNATESANSINIVPTTEDLYGILEIAVKPKLDSRRHSPQARSIETVVEDSEVAGPADSIGCLNQETPELKLVSQEGVQEPEKTYGSDLVERQDAIEDPLAVEDSWNEETDAPTDCGEPPVISDDPDASSHPDVVPAGNGTCPLSNDESGKVDEELRLAPDEQRPAKFQKISHGETGRRRTRKPVK